MWIPSLGREDPLEEEHGKPTPVFLPGESPGQRSLEGYSPQGHKELVTTEHTGRLVYHPVHRPPPRPPPHPRSCETSLWS